MSAAQVQFALCGCYVKYYISGVYCDESLYSDFGFNVMGREKNAPHNISNAVHQYFGVACLRIKCTRCCQSFSTHKKRMKRRRKEIPGQSNIVCRFSNVHKGFNLQLVKVEIHDISNYTNASYVFLFIRWMKVRLIWAKHKRTAA